MNYTNTSQIELTVKYWQTEAPVVAEMSDKIFCDACNIEFSAKQAYINHLRGMTHIMNASKSEDNSEMSIPENNIQEPQEGNMDSCNDEKAEEKEEEDNAPNGDEEDKNSDKTFCDACDKEFESNQAYFNHLRGLTHIMNASAEENGGERKKPVAKKFPPIKIETVACAKGKKKKGTPGAMYVFRVCELCNCKCTNPQAYESHISGARHAKTLKSIELAKQREAAPPEIKRIIDVTRRKNDTSKASSVEEPSQVIVEVDDDDEITKAVTAWSDTMIGVHCVEKIKVVTGDTYVRFSKCIYRCRLCDVRLLHAVMVVTHITGQLHRKKYMKQNYPKYYKAIEEQTGIQLQAKLIVQYASEIEAKEGRRKVRLRVQKLTKQEPQKKPVTAVSSAASEASASTVVTASSSLTQKPGLITSKEQGGYITIRPKKRETSEDRREPRTERSTSRSASHDHRDNESSWSSKYPQRSDTTWSSNRSPPNHHSAREWSANRSLQSIHSRTNRSDRGFEPRNHITSPRRDSSPRRYNRSPGSYRSPPPGSRRSPPPGYRRSPSPGSRRYTPPGSRRSPLPGSRRWYTPPSRERRQHRMSPYDSRAYPRMSPHDTRAYHKMSPRQYDTVDLTLSPNRNSERDVSSSRDTGYDDIMSFTSGRQPLAPQDTAAEKFSAFHCSVSIRESLGSAGSMMSSLHQEAYSRNSSQNSTQSNYARNNGGLLPLPESGPSSFDGMGSYGTNTMQLSRPEDGFNQHSDSGIIQPEDTSRKIADAITKFRLKKVQKYTNNEGH